MTAQIAPLTEGELSGGGRHLPASGRHQRCIAHRVDPGCGSHVSVDNQLPVDRWQANLGDQGIGADSGSPDNRGSLDHLPVGERNSTGGHLGHGRPEREIDTARLQGREPPRPTGPSTMPV